MKQTCDLMNKNRIRGLPDRTSEPVIAKSASSMRRGGKFGRCAGKAVGLTLGDLRCVRSSRTEHVVRHVIAVQKSAEGIVCAGQRPDQAGSNPAGARIRGAISKSGGNASLAGLYRYAIV